jgi:hypothetical protein
MPTPVIPRWFRDPIFLLALAAGLIAFVVQSGELGTADTQHRLQSAHALWTSEPPVFPQEYPEFGVHGRNGKLQSWYGIGQSLLLLPADLVGTYVERLPVFGNYNGNDPSVKNVFVSYTINILVTVLTALVCFRFLRQLNFGVKDSVAGVLSLLLLTTHLHYTQNMMENNYIFLLTLTGLSYQYEWVCSGSRRALLIGSSAFGLNLLTRLTTGMDLLAGAVFVLLVLWFEGIRGSALWDRCRSYIAVALPVYLFFGLLDRLYQYYRFGSFINTYVSIVAREARQREPTLPVGYPWETPFHVGFFGALFSPEKSIFLFDPLLVVMILLAAVAWKRFNPAVKGHTLSADFCCYWPTSASMRDTPFGAAISPGATVTFRPAPNWRRCLLFRCCCVIATLWEPWSGAWESRFASSVRWSRSHRSPSGCRSRSTRWRRLAIRPS